MHGDHAWSPVMALVVVLAAAPIALYRAAMAALAAAAAMLGFAGRTLAPLEAERLLASRDGRWRSVRARATPGDVESQEPPVRRVPRPTRRSRPARRYPPGPR